MCVIEFVDKDCNFGVRNLRIYGLFCLKFDFGIVYEVVIEYYRILLLFGESCLVFFSCQGIIFHLKTQ